MNFSLAGDPYLSLLSSSLFVCIQMLILRAAAAANVDIPKKAFNVSYSQLAPAQGTEQAKGGGTVRLTSIEYCTTYLKNSCEFDKIRAPFNHTGQMMMKIHA